MSFIRRKNKENLEVDEIFLDVANSPGFNNEGLEGSLERPIRREVFVYTSLVFILIAFFFVSRLGYLQLVKGNELFARGENNHLRFVDIYPERGGIYDKDGKLLASNEFFGYLLGDGQTDVQSDESQEWVRRYPVSGFLHVLGFLRNTEGKLLEGVSGLEAYYDELLRGEPGKNIEEVSATGNVIDSGLYSSANQGHGISTSLSYGLQTKLSEIISQTAGTYGFKGGAGVVLDIKTGGVLALVSVPGFDPNIFFEDHSGKKITELLNDPSKPFFNRAISGLYPPGSIVKMAVAAGALNERLIDPAKKIFSSGSLTLPNPYVPDKPSVFRDWKPHGWVNMIDALAVSSDVYFYTIGGGFEEQKGLGVENINKYYSIFGFGKSTGIDLFGEKKGSLPDPYSEERIRPWTVGDTYNISIGQGELQVTPLQMAVYAAKIASRNNFAHPRIGQAVFDEHKEIVKSLGSIEGQDKSLPDEVYDILHAGMRKAVTEGTASALSGLPIKVAAKTGTAEIGKTGRVHSWSIGFFPYEDPRVAYAVLMEDGSEKNLVGATFVAHETIQWIAKEDFLAGLDVK